MDARSLTAAGTRYYTLRGLLLVPTGLLLLAAGLFNMPARGAAPASGSAVWFWGAVAVAAIGYVGFNRYYVTTFGRVEPSRRTLVRISIHTVAGVALISAGITLDMQRDLPVTLFGAAYGASLLVYYRMLDVLRPHHWVLLGGLVVLSLAPIWGGAHDKVSVAMLPMGVVTVVVGLLDHRDLVSSLREARSARVEEDARDRG